MKKLVITLVGVVVATALATSAFAQAAGPNGAGIQGEKAGKGQRAGGQKGGHLGMGRKMISQLNLTPDQQKKVAALTKDFAAKVKELRDANGAGGAATVGG